MSKYGTFTGRAINVGRSIRFHAENTQLDKIREHYKRFAQSRGICVDPDWNPFCLPFVVVRLDKDDRQTDISFLAKITVTIEYYFQPYHNGGGTGVNIKLLSLQRH